MGDMHARRHRLSAVAVSMAGVMVTHFQRHNATNEAWRHAAGELTTDGRKIR